MKCKKQYAALPYVVLAGGLEVCLITSREAGRWIIPKGWPEKGLAPHAVAALEALEEAGLKGKVARKAIDSFRYVKRMSDDREVDCEVAVFPMLVESHAVTWPEKGQRKATWVKPKKAAKLVGDAGLAKLLRRFAVKGVPSKKAA